MFESRTYLEHLARGAIGVLAVFLSLRAEPPALALALGAAALVALRGCPLCWATGLAAMTIARLRGGAVTGACTDGRCQTRRG
jgi:hypothetical protein